MDPMIGSQNNLLVTYNNFNTTKECLESIMATNYPYYNVIIIDNGFTNITEYNCFKSSLDCNIHILNQSKINFLSTCEVVPVVTGRFCVCFITIFQTIVYSHSFVTLTAY